MRAENVLQRFRKAGALLEGHFILTSGLHSRTYLQCALVLQYSEEAQIFGRELADHFTNVGVEAVVSPAIGGIIIGYEVARALGVRAIWTERELGVMTLRRGFTVASGEKVLVIEDVVTTGGSTRETINTLEKMGVEIVGAGSIIDRSGGEADIGYKRVALATLDIASYDPSQCPLCAQGLVAIKPGSRVTEQLMQNQSS